MKVNFLVLAMVIVSLLFIGGVSADTPTTKVVGTITGIPEKTVTITPPPTPLIWNLDMSNPNNNQITVGDIHIVANCDYQLVIRASTGGYMIGEQGAAMTFPTLKNPVYVWDGTGFSAIENGGSTQLVIYNGHAGTVDVPLKLQQVLAAQDADKKSPTIVFSFDTIIL